MNKAKIWSRFVTDVQAEANRQDNKWGADRIIPSIPPVGSSDKYRNYELMIPRESAAKGNCELAARQGRVTWAHIAIEELCEAIDAPDDATRRGELVQLAAVIFQWINSIDQIAQADAQAAEYHGQMKDDRLFEQHKSTPEELSETMKWLSGENTGPEHNV